MPIAAIRIRSNCLWFNSQDWAVLACMYYSKLQLINIAEATIETYRGAFLRISNSSSVGKGRPKTSFGLGFFFFSVIGSLPGKDSGALQDSANKF